MNNENDNLEVLSTIQVRVLACLMEKHLATPKNYPLTPNSLTLACNQKSNRYPTMALEEGKVVHTAQQLNETGFVSIEYGERIAKFSHRAPGKLKISREEQAVLAMLMLRGPLTLNDIKARTDKMVGFDSVEQVKETIEQLMARNSNLIMKLPVATGQREERYTHLLAGQPDFSEFAVKATKTPKTNYISNEKIEELEARIARLEVALDIQTEKF